MILETTQQKLKIAVLISGGGSNLRAIHSAIEAGKLDAEIVLVVSSRPDAQGLIFANKKGIATCSLNKEMYADAQMANHIICTEVRNSGAEFIAMAGYMRKLGVEVLDEFEDRVINLHPALLPSFKGAHAIEDAFNAGVKISGITIHFANEDYDKGPIIAQRAVEISEGDTLDSFEKKIHDAEHRLYPEVLQMLAQGKISIDKRRIVRISN